MKSALVGLLDLVLNLFEFALVHFNLVPETLRLQEAHIVAALLFGDDAGRLLVNLRFETGVEFFGVLFHLFYQQLLTQGIHFSFLARHHFLKPLVDRNLGLLFADDLAPVVNLGLFLGVLEFLAGALDTHLVAAFLFTGGVSKQPGHCLLELHLAKV